jgi:hypothetical protein
LLGPGLSKILEGLSCLSGQSWTHKFLRDFNVSVSSMWRPEVANVLIWWGRCCWNTFGFHSSHLGFSIVVNKMLLVDYVLEVLLNLI